MKYKKFLIQMSILIAVSVCIYLIQVLVFHDARNTAFYILQDMAFLPITIVVTTYLVGTILERKSKRDRIESSRILSCAFFSIIGNPMMELLCSMQEGGKIYWNEAGFRKLLDLLDSHKETILTIASNPNLLEHEGFTDLLWSVLHLREELYGRKDCEIGAIGEEDRMHLVMDAQRVLDLFLKNWDEYYTYIEKEYPYYFMSDAFMRWKKPSAD